ncbi:hypothetical protein MTZ49_07665 [Entomomonas sp. E2T0]|uniref:hypothetical protein n=1 Tax=Entomomonas sp. E2T0 TaxID=2930213 RepID=UPI0022282BCE|nr:hypothetical protein [Entomomonas sp. E2T0]UYZ85416.1 hypothetical protein MTZ49_07665 [Entomomonas sp. E2T0]
MSYKKSPPHFVTLNSNLQSNGESVLYYNANASLDAIYECAIGRLKTVTDLLENLYEFKAAPTNTIIAICSISTLLLNEAATLLEELDPVAVQLRKEK